MDMTILSSTKYSALQLHIRRSWVYISAYSYEIEIVTVKLKVVWNSLWHYSLSWVSIQIHFLIIENLFPFNYLFILLFYYFFFVFNWIRLNKFRINMSVFFFISQNVGWLLQNTTSALMPPACQTCLNFISSCSH